LRAEDKRVRDRQREAAGLMCCRSCRTALRRETRCALPPAEAAEGVESWASCESERAGASTRNRKRQAHRTKNAEKCPGGCFGGPGGRSGRVWRIQDRESEETRPKRQRGWRCPLN